MVYKLTLEDIGFNKILDKQFKGKAPIFYKPKLPLNISYSRLVKDMEKDDILWTLPKVINACEIPSEQNYINMIVENMGAVIMNFATNINAPIKSITKFFNKNILSAKIQTAKIERDLIVNVLEVFEKTSKEYVIELNKIQNEIRGIIALNINPSNKSLLQERLEYRGKAINEHLAQMKEIAMKLEKEFNDLVLNGVIQAQQVAYSKIATILSSYPVTQTIFSGLSEGFITSIIPKISEQTILNLLSNQHPIGVGIGDTISRQMRDVIAKTNIIKGENVFITAKELEAQFGQHLEGVFNSTTYRANMIARTNVIYAENMTTYQTIKEFGVQKFIVIGSEADPPCLVCPPIWGEIFDIQKDTDKIPPEHPNCFFKGTKIKTDNGLKNIEDVKLGDKVLSDKGVYEEVTYLHRNKTEENMYNLNGLKITGNHKIPVYREGTVIDVKVKDIIKTDKLIGIK